MTMHHTQNREIILTLSGGRVSKSDYGYLDAFLYQPGIESVSIRPYRDNLAVVFPTPYSEKTTSQICRFISCWHIKGKIVVQAKRQHSR